MLFNSYIFVFAFFPASLLLYHLLAARGWTRAAHVAIVASSVFFYAWWDWRFVGLLAEPDAALLIHADHVWRSVQGMLRIVVDRSVGYDLPEASARPLLAAARAAKLDAVDLAGLHANLDELAQQVRAIFVRYIGEIG